jgi:hypothetical protein
MEMADEPKLDLAWGARAIGEEIDRSERETYHLLNRQAIKCARKVAGQWVADRGALRAEFRGEALA